VTVVGQVVEAIAVLERLAPPDAKLFNSAAAKVEQTHGQVPQLGALFRAFIAWQNEHGAGAGLPPIPDVDGRQWPLSLRQFRRTLARQLAFKPHGTIAAKVHLKHVEAAITEGYFGPVGASASAFLRERDELAQDAREDNYLRRFEQWRNGEPIAGGASRKLIREFEDVAAAFQGTAEPDERRLQRLIRKRSGLLHIGPINDCHFTDPRQARCLKARGIEDADAPLIAACQPSKCANAVVTPEHQQLWERPLLQIENLLDDRKTPKNERARLQAQKQEYENVIAPLRRSHG
jgi:hypothetical protein